VTTKVHALLRRARLELDADGLEIILDRGFFVLAASKHP
jgi:hypothetical protein